MAKRATALKPESVAVREGFWLVEGDRWDSRAHGRMFPGGMFASFEAFNWWVTFRVSDRGHDCTLIWRTGILGA
jgi:hypothetical protein